MLSVLDNAQLKQLKKAIEATLADYEIVKCDENKQTETDEIVIEKFLSAKRVEGCSEKSLRYYKSTIMIMLGKVEKSIDHITTDDLREYLTVYQSEKNSSKVTIDNIRRILSSFFSWLEDEDYILKSPVRRIHKVRAAATIKETYPDEALELMRDNCDNLRDLALIDILSSTGMRVGELVRLNRDDINFEERECVVFGKGSKERMVYFDARTKIHLQNYLSSRKDSEKALFVGLKAPYKRLSIAAIEVRLRELGTRLNIAKVHPHKFRRTLAMRAIDKGMPIEQLQHLLGHERIDTTLQYAMVKQSNVKIAHRKYIGYERSLYYIHVHLRHQQNVPSRFSFATHKSSSNTFLAILCFQAFSFPYEFIILFLRFTTTIIVTTTPARITTAPTKIKAYPHIGI